MPVRVSPLKSATLAPKLAEAARSFRAKGGLMLAGGASSSDPRGRGRRNGVGETKCAAWFLLIEDDYRENPLPPPWHVRCTYTLSEYPHMTKVFNSQAIDIEWKNVSSHRPCPICGASAACRTHPDGMFACCAQEPSEWPMTNGAWLHRIELATVVELRSANSRHEEASPSRPVLGALP